MSNSYKVTVPPVTEPITLANVKAWLRVDWSDDDALLSSLITRARSYAETVTGRAFATQTIQCVETIERPPGGELSGPFTPGPNWYQYNEMLGANPFGPAQFYFDLPMPPLQTVTTIETMVTAFDGAWSAFTGTTYPDNNREPARLYFQVPVTANFWRFTYQAGYDGSTYILPPDLQECLFQLVAYWYENRDTPAPDTITKQLMLKRVDWM